MTNEPIESFRRGSRIVAKLLHCAHHQTRAEAICESLQSQDGQREKRRVLIIRGVIAGVDLKSCHRVELQPEFGKSLGVRDLRNELQLFRLGFASALASYFPVGAQTLKLIAM
jgi:hypothetical protein